ncbi:MAG: diguanylate cyclase [Spirochaetota bacterium]
MNGKNKILLVEDSPETSLLLTRVLEKEGYLVTSTSDGKEALNLLEENIPDVIILDLYIEGLPGLEVCRLIRTEPRNHPVYIIMLTSEKDSVVDGLDSGADDYMVKPSNLDELKARVRKGVRSAEDKRFSIQDSQTSWYNKHFFDLYQNTKISFLVKESIPISIVMADIDYFKKINDTYGHDMGDTILVEFSQVLKSNCRKRDVPIRWGGEEFIILLLGITVATATKVAERMRSVVANHTFSKDLKVTASFGVSLYQTDEKDFFKGADEALYQAKEAGRNCVVAIGI